MKTKKKKLKDTVKRSYDQNPKYIRLKNNIVQYNTNVFNPNYDKSLNKLSKQTNSWFNFEIFEDNTIINNTLVINDNNIDGNEESLDAEYKSKKIILLLNPEQRHILKIWYNCNDKMYNETLKFIKDNYINFNEEFDNSIEIKNYNNITTKISCNKYEIKNICASFKNNKSLKKIKKGQSKKEYKIYVLSNTNNIEHIDKLRKCIFYELNNKELNKELENAKIKLNNYLKDKPYSLSYGKFKLNYRNIRTYFLKNKKQEIINNCFSNILKKDIKIKSHILDCAIKIACSNYQSAITNFIKGNIKHFRIRYWKEKRSMRVLEIENCYFTGNSMCPSIFGSIKGYFKNGNKKIDFDFSTINKSCKLHYDKNTKEYSLFVPEKINIKDIQINNSKKHLIGIDPGLRTFITCLSNNEAINICNTKGSRLELLINKKLKLKSLKPNKKIKKKVKSVNKRIKGLVDELHWKTIKFLTDNYDTILIGDMSTKGIVSNSGSNLNNYNKQLAYSLSFFKYRERLKYKCTIKNCNYVKVNEYYTSKTCSVCANVKNDLGSNKIYECTICKSKIDRDINGCRNIIMKCL